MKQTTFEEFVDLARRGTFVPVVKEIIADLLTPVSAFLKIAEHSDYAFLFESVEGGERVARYSFLGKDPFLVLKARGSRTTIDRAGVRTETDEPFVAVLRRMMAEFQAPYVPGLPRFTGGAVGFIGYDAAPVFEPALSQAWRDASWASGPAEDDAGFMLFDTVLAFDHVKHRILIVANARITADEDLQALYQFACAKIQFLERELERSLSQSNGAGACGAADPIEPDARAVRSRRPDDQGAHRRRRHLPGGAVAAVRGRHHGGSVHRLPRAAARQPVAVHVFHPAGRPGDRRLVARDAGAGRRAARGDASDRRHAAARRNEEDDLRLGEELKRNEKERAEHVMLVDLGRNDLGRVCQFGTVRVPQYMALERYSHVMHLVSTVDGTLAEDHDHLDALVACFPAGTVSGAPKIRAMQILSELEPTRRDVYAGAVGYIDFAGNLDFCIAIRTITIRDGVARVQAGAGIVADSNPAAEYEETRDKARALLQALAMAEEGL